MKNNWVMVINIPGEHGKLKASIVVDRCVYNGIACRYELVGECHTVSVLEDNVKAAMGVR